MPPPRDIVLVHGFWEGPGIWRIVAPALEARGYRVTVVKLPGTGTPGSADGKGPTMHTDIATIRDAITSILNGNGDDGDEGRDVLLVGHSAGAWLGSHAVRDLNRVARARDGKTTAVVRLAFIAGLVFPVGHVLGPGPGLDYQGDKMYLLDARNELFNDIEDEAEAQREVDRLTFQAGVGWDGVVEYAGWKDIPSAYLVCLRDNILPVSFQEFWSKEIGADPIDTCDAAHCVQVTRPQVVVDWIVKIAESSSGLRYGVL